MHADVEIATSYPYQTSHDKCIHQTVDCNPRVRSNSPNSNLLFSLCAPESGELATQSFRRSGPAAVEDVQEHAMPNGGSAGYPGGCSLEQNLGMWGKRLYCATIYETAVCSTSSSPACRYFVSLDLLEATVYPYTRSRALPRSRHDNKTHPTRLSRRLNLNHDRLQGLRPHPDFRLVAQSEHRLQPITPPTLTPAPRHILCL